MSDKLLSQTNKEFITKEMIEELCKTIKIHLSEIKNKTAKSENLSKEVMAKAILAIKYLEEIISNEVKQTSEETELVYLLCKDQLSEKDKNDFQCSTIYQSKKALQICFEQYFDYKINAKKELHDLYFLADNPKICPREYLFFGHSKKLLEIIYEHFIEKNHMNKTGFTRFILQNSKIFEPNFYKNLLEVDKDSDLLTNVNYYNNTYRYVGILQIINTLPHDTDFSAFKDKMMFDFRKINLEYVYKYLKVDNDEKYPICKVLWNGNQSSGYLLEKEDFENNVQSNFFPIKIPHYSNMLLNAFHVYSNSKHVRETLENFFFRQLSKIPKGSVGDTDYTNYQYILYIKLLNIKDSDMFYNALQIPKNRFDKALSKYPGLYECGKNFLSNGAFFDHTLLNELLYINQYLKENNLSFEEVQHELRTLSFTEYSNVTNFLEKMNQKDFIDSSEMSEEEKDFLYKNQEVPRIRNFIMQHKLWKNFNNFHEQMQEDYEEIYNSLSY